MPSNRYFVAALAAAGVLLPSGLVHGGRITDLDWHSGVASVAGTDIPDPPSLNNDDVAGASDNFITILQKHYVGIGPVDIVLTVVDTGGLTEYAVIEGVFNDTGLDWTGYHLELGYGFGEDFVKALPGDMLNFDAPDYNSPFDFPGLTSVMVSEHDVIASGGIIPVFTYWSGIMFHIDVPDGITEFTIRQSPIPVPAPGAAPPLAALALAVAAFRRRRTT